MSRPTLTTLPSTTPLPLVQAPDQYSMQPTLQSYLECLERHSERMINTCREMLEIHSRLKELLPSDQSEVTEGTWDGTVDIQATVNEPQTIAPSVLDEVDASTWSSDLSFPEPLPFYSQLPNGPLASVGSTGLLLEGVNHSLVHIRKDVVPYSSSDPDGYEPMAQDFVPQHSTYSEEQTLSSSSAEHDEQLPVQEKVQCTRPGCSSVVNKSNLTRHINEVHERKVKARCASCLKGFARPYMMYDHVLRGKCVPRFG